MPVGCLFSSVDGTLMGSVPAVLLGTCTLLLVTDVDEVVSWLVVATELVLAAA